MRATRAKGLRQFPALDSYADVINNENNETPANVNEPNKRIRTLHVPTEDKRGSSAKSVRFKIEDKSTHVPISPFPGYEIRGNAIKTGSEYSKSAPPATRRSEVQQRQAHIHTSLQLFKRRLKLNQDNYLAPNSTVRESDYIIRRIPLKLDKRIPNVTSDAPIEPRLSATNLPHRSRTPSARPPTPDKVTSARRRAMPVASGVRPVSSGSKSQNEETPERKVRFSYRLPDNLSLGKEVSFVEESEPIPSVNTYVLEEKKRKGSKMYEQATLSTHNLGVHDALTANDTSRIPVGEEGDVDQRLVKWVEESNVNNHTRKMSRLRSTSVDKDVTDHVNEAPRFLSEGDRSLTVA
ncbi:hypothetical protein FSP39_003505 [Pinctada imbricata]|uniref:Uncharacterized protein n=1 Tax=Pinctada imbricata TaxID=66713 RepID=A0AA88Y5A3_PINIB|nr:hypothetical protein FSP39_003505 [Pinctada imbricata]